MQAIFGGQHFCGDWRKESKLFAILADIYQRNCSNKFKITEIENKFDYIFKKWIKSSLCLKRPLHFWPQCWNDIEFNSSTLSSRESKSKAEKYWNRYIISDYF